MKEFRNHLWGTIIEPRRTFLDILEKKKLGEAWGAVLLVGILYTIVGAVALVKGYQPQVEPLLPIDKSSYYAWQLLFGPPVFLTAWYIFAAVSFFLGNVFSSQATFRQLLVLFAFALTAPMIPLMWATDIVVISLGIKLVETGAFGQIWNIFYQAVTLVWMIFLLTLATQLAHRFSWLRAMLLTLISLIPTTLLVAIFLR